MLTTEFNLDEAREVWQEEARAEGEQLGEQRSRQLEALQIARAMKEKGLSDKVIIEITQLTPRDIAGLFDGAQNGGDWYVDGRI
jgi:predicted transposase YdaD